MDDSGNKDNARAQKVPFFASDDVRNDANCRLCDLLDTFCVKQRKVLEKVAKTSELAIEMVHEQVSADAGPSAVLFSMKSALATAHGETEKGKD